MLPIRLENGAIPDSADKFIECLEFGLDRYYRHPGSHVTVSEDYSTDRVSSLTIDLTEAALDLAGLSASGEFELAAVSNGDQRLAVGDMSIIASPLFINGRRVRVELDAQDVEMAYGKTENGKDVLAWQAGRGHYRMSAEKNDLEELLTTVVNQNLLDRGVQITKVRLHRIRPNNEAQTLNVVVGLSGWYRLLPFGVQFDADAKFHKTLKAAARSIHPIGLAVLLRPILQPSLDKFVLEDHRFGTSLFPMEIEEQSAGQANRIDIDTSGPLSLTATFS